MPSPTSILAHDALLEMVRTELFGHGRFHHRDSIGLEAELFPIYRGASGAARPVPLRSVVPGTPSISELFARVCKRHGWRLSEEAGVLSICCGGAGSLTLEPAGQIEYSGLPMHSVLEAVNDARAVIGLIEEEGRALGIELMECGYSSIFDAEENGLQIRKPRYVAMDRYFGSIGPFGRKMMRATCALQINLDIGDHRTRARRWLLANLMAPAMNALFANSPHAHDGERFGSFRHEIWRQADPSRTGRVLPGPWEDPAAAYLRFALDARVMMIQEEGGEMSVPAERLSFAEWMTGHERSGYPDWSDWRLHLSTLFPDVRARGWMEIRSIDMLPRRWWSVPVAIACTLLYNDECLDAALELIESTRGSTGQPNGHPVGREADYGVGCRLLALAYGAIPNGELRADLASYCDTFVITGTTPGDAIDHAEMRTAHRAPGVLEPDGR
ncbi:MAG: hypothetical protein JST22_16790 [Bacteroidetes bacterium]|nr:hypothetical protein [Bacteroidota bacterium]